MPFKSFICLEPQVSGGLTDSSALSIFFHHGYCKVLGTIKCVRIRVLLAYFSVLIDNACYRFFLSNVNSYVLQFITSSWYSSWTEKLQSSIRACVLTNSAAWYLPIQD